MIQLYVDRNDLIYSEITNRNQIPVIELTESIKNNGILYSLNIKPDGYILRGNTRAEGSSNPYVPISLDSLIGLFVNSDGTHIRIRKSIIDHYEKSNDPDFRECDRVISNRDHARFDYEVPMKYDDDFYYYYKL